MLDISDKFCWISSHNQCDILYKKSCDHKESVHTWLWHRNKSYNDRNHHLRCDSRSSRWNSATIDFRSNEHSVRSTQRPTMLWFDHWEKEMDRTFDWDQQMLIFEVENECHCFDRVRFLHWFDRIEFDIHQVRWDSRRKVLHEEANILFDQLMERDHSRVKFLIYRLMSLDKH